MTPLDIEIGLHYYVHDDYEFPDWETPACRESIDRMWKAGLLNFIPYDDQEFDGPQWHATDGLYAWIDHLCETAWPENQWSYPVWPLLKL